MSAHFSPKHSKPLFQPTSSRNAGGPCLCGSCKQPTSGEPTAGIVFSKRSSLTEAPLPGAEFRIVQNGRIVTTATSDINGHVRFPALTPGAYQLWEVRAPKGFAVSGVGLSLIVAPDSRVTVEGAIADDLILYNSPIPTSSAPVAAEEAAPEEDPAKSSPQKAPVTCEAPGIDPVAAGASAVTGTGQSGAHITLYFPGGAEGATTVFGGRWHIFVPGDTVLSLGDVLSAVQTCERDESTPATITVT